jgi:5,10-methylenetetrahydromethanopterin reductase
MRIGTFVGEPAGPDPIASLRSVLEQAVTDGFTSAWLPHIFGADALTAIAVAARDVPGIELGTGVVPTYPRHPMALAQQALTTQAAIGGRLFLGIGLSHRIVIENMFGLSFDRPAVHMREYLSVLLPLLQGKPVSFQGEQYRVNGALTVPGADPVPVLLAALAPRMLQLAGSMTEGTVTWMTGPDTLRDHIVPSISAAAEAAGRPPPRIVASLPIAVTDDPDGARERAGNVFSIYGQLPSYRAMLDREGATGPGDVAIVGDEETVRAGVSRVADAGVTDFVASQFLLGDEGAPTRALLRDLATASGR